MSDFLNLEGVSELSTQIADAEKVRIANNLSTTQEGFVLDARQGAVLLELIQSIGSGVTISKGSVSVTPTTTITSTGNYLGTGGNTSNYTNSARTYKVNATPILTVPKNSICYIWMTNTSVKISNVYGSSYSYYLGGTKNCVNVYSPSISEYSEVEHLNPEKKYTIRTPFDSSLVIKTDEGNNNGYYTAASNTPSVDPISIRYEIISFK